VDYTSSLIVGYAGTGSLTIANGATVSSGTSIIAANAGSTGTVTISDAGSLWTITSSLVIGSSGGNALLEIIDGGAVSVTGGITIGAFGKLQGNSAVAANVINGGYVAPGASIGQLAITGNYNQQLNGKLQIELGGTQNGEFDSLTVTGSATLGGTLDVVLVADYSPMLGASFDFLSATSLSGSFSTLKLPALTTGLQWDLSQLYTEGLISVAALPGDQNGDGMVDAADYVTWRKMIGTTAQYAMWRANFGASGGSESGEHATAAIPEPATSAMLIVVIAGWCLRRPAQ
jgi:T5SS/PEP-CTERM-associated repeat protein